MPRGCRITHRSARKSAVLLAAASAIGGLSSSLFAASGTFTYTAGGTSWTNATAWLFGNPYPNGINEVANFTTVDLAPVGPATYPITLDTIVTVGQINFADAASATPGGWQLVQGGSSTLTLSTGTAAQPILNVGAMGNNATVSLVDIAVPLYGNNGFIKLGAGRLRLSSDNLALGALTGSISLQGGTLEIASTANLGATDSTIGMAGGTLSLRSDGTLNLSDRNLIVTVNSGLNVDRSATNFTSNVTGIFDSIGTITMGSGGRSLTITGSNFYGVNVGTMVVDVGNTAAVVNELAPGQLTIANVITPGLSGASTLTFGGTNNVATGNGIQITNSILQTVPSSTLSVVYSDAHTMSVGSFSGLTGNLLVTGGGSLIVGSGRLSTGSLGVSNGTLDFSATGLVSTVTHLQMGGGTSSYINTGNPGGLQVLGNVTFTESTGGLGANFNGNLAFGSAAHTLQINGINGIPTQEMTVNAAVSGSGTLTKNGSGQILLTSANALSAAVVINQGTFSGAALGSGNALTSGGVTISGGTLRLVNQSATPGSGSIGSLLFNGASTNAAILVVDAGTSSSATSLNIGAFLGRVPGVNGALTVIPKTGGLDSTEIITVGSMASAVGTATNHGILAPYVAAQASGSNTSIDFLATSGTHIVGGGAVYQTGDINSLPANSVYSATGTSTAGGPVQMFAVKADGTLANIAGATLTLGDGALAGLILNNGAQITSSNLVINAGEAIFWSGGRVLDVDGTTILAAGGSISSNVSFATSAGALTTSGSQTLTLSGGLDMGGVSRTVTVSNGTAIFSGPLSNGNLTKSGPNYMILTNANAGMTGNLNVASGTLQVGQGLLMPNAALGSSTVTIGNGNLVFNLDGVKTVSNLITSTGTGAVIVDSPTGVITLGNVTSSFTSLTVNQGAVQLGANNQLPSAATLTVQNTGSFNMNGFSQTIGALNGTAGTGIVTNSGAGFSTLTINRTASNTSTFSGLIANGSGLALNKLGAGTQILIGSNSFDGGTRIVAGVLQLNNSTSAGHGSIQLLGGTLALNNTSTPLNQISVGVSTGTITVVPGGNTGTINGPIMLSGGTLAAVFSGNNGTLAVNAVGLDPANFNGTLAFFSSGTGTGTFRLPQATNLAASTLNFGTAGVQMVLNNTSTFGTVLGGSNASFASGGTAAIGDGGGISSFAGAIGSNLNKVGLGTLIVSSTTVKNHGMGSVQIVGGALVFGQNARLSADVTMNVGTFTKLNNGGDPNIQNSQVVKGDGGDLYFTGDANFTGNATVNLTSRGKWDVSGVPGGYAGASGLTIMGSGLITGAYSHNAGTFMPGGAAKTGTITFNSPANPAPLTFGDNGSVQLDFTVPGSLSVGGGTNDLIFVNGDVNFNPKTFYRFNYIGNGSVNAGDDYPLMQFTGGSTGWGTGGSISTAAGQVRSAFRADMVLKQVGTPGNNVIAAHVNSVSNNAQVLTWTGTENGRSGEPQGFFHVWKAAELRSYSGSLAKQMNTQKLAMTALGGGGNRTFQIAHREGDGQAEFHAKQADVFFVVSGNARLIEGGTIVGGAESAPDEIRGRSITGGTEATLAAGDVVTIPPKTPHQLKVSKEFTYFVVKVNE